MKKLLSIALLMSFGVLNMHAAEKESFLTKLKKKAGEVKESASKQVKKISGSDDESLLKKGRALLKKIESNPNKADYESLMKLQKQSTPNTASEFHKLVSKARAAMEKTGTEQILKKQGEAEYKRNREATQREEERQAKILSEQLRKENQAKRKEGEEMRAKSAEMGRMRMAAGEEEEKADPEFLAKYNELKNKRRNVEMNVLNGNSQSGRDFNALVDIAMRQYTTPSQQKALRALAVGGVK